MSGGEEPPFSQWAVAAQASSSLLGPVGLGLLLDTQFGWSPWATVTGVIVGFVGCLTLLIRMAKRGDKPDA